MGTWRRTQQLARHKREERAGKKKAVSMPQALKIRQVEEISRDTGNTKRWRRETEIQENTQVTNLTPGNLQEPEFLCKELSDSVALVHVANIFSRQLNALKRLNFQTFQRAFNGMHNVFRSWGARVFIGTSKNADIKCNSSNELRSRA
eukprot:1156826-Pelagomonas_calceolata.AAC.4